jgi:hypothetical protein
MLFKIRFPNETLTGVEWALKTMIYVSTNVMREIMDSSGKIVIFLGMSGRNSQMTPYKKPVF